MKTIVVIAYKAADKQNQLFHSYFQYSFFSSLLPTIVRDAHSTYKPVCSLPQARLSTKILLLQTEPGVVRLVPFELWKVALIGICVCVSVLCTTASPNSNSTLKIAVCAHIWSSTRHKTVFSFSLSNIYRRSTAEDFRSLRTLDLLYTVLSTKKFFNLTNRKTDSRPTATKSVPLLYHNFLR